MPKGISLHVGINKVGDAFPNAAPLLGCEHDAYSMRDVAEQSGFYKRVLLPSEESTYERVTDEIKTAAGQLKSGDIFLFTFAGHGSGEADQGGGEAGGAPELDFQDEAMLLQDKMLFDDDLARNLWPRFSAGVRVLMVADCCHSGTISALFFDPLAHPHAAVRPRPGLHARKSAAGVAVAKSVASPRVRKISSGTRLKHLADNEKFYKNLMGSLGNDPIKANVLLLPACRDDQDAADGPDHGAFTRTLLEVWDGGKFVGSYGEFIGEIRQRLIAAGFEQNPDLSALDPRDLNFEAQRPFFIA